MRILVVGDSCKDVFVYGKVNRLTPEAPVPVFNPTVTKTNDGMARNVSNNPKQMVIFSVIFGLISVLVGLFTSLKINSASGPSIITATLLLFILSLIKFKKVSDLKK